jgi:hypothetical protein
MVGWLAACCFSPSAHLVVDVHRCRCRTRSALDPLHYSEQGLAYLFALPVAAVAMALMVLLVNIDPTGPRLTLTLRNLEQYTPGARECSAPGLPG